MDIIINVDALARVGVCVNHEKPRVQRAVGVSYLDKLIIPAHNIGLGVGVKQIARGLEGKRFVDLIQLLLVCRCKRLGIVVAVGESPGNASIAHKCRKSYDTLAFRYAEVQIGIMT